MRDCLIASTLAGQCSGLTGHICSRVKLNGNKYVAEVVKVIQVSSTVGRHSSNPTQGAILGDCFFLYMWALN